MKWYMSIVKAITYWGLNKLFNYIDKNKDGALDKDEIKEFVAKLESIAKSIKKK
jgi:Ca2+-binding EF-hand superfamily protein